MWALRLRRWYRQRRGGIHPPLAAYWQADLPAPGAPWTSLDFLVCDCEMSGLDPATSELLSVGWVHIEAGEIRLDSATHRLIRNAESVGQSAAIHQLRDCELTAGESCEAVLCELLAAAEGKVLVFHHAPIDLAFLNRACTAHFGAPLLAPVADTLAIEHRLLARGSDPPAQGALRLQACRDRYGLPTHPAHNALTDALATAELFLAQLAHRGEGVTGRDILKPR